MAKTPDIVEVFNFGARNVPKELVGSLMAACNRLGISEITFDLVTEQHTYKQKQRHETSSATALASWVKEHPTFKAIEAVKYLESQGRTRGSTYPALGELVAAGVLKKLGDGNYARADVKQLAAPKKTAKPAKKKQDRREISHGDFVLRTASRNHGRFSRQTMITHFEKDGRDPTSIGWTLNDLIAKKLLKRVNEGEYILLRGNTTAKKPTAKKPTTKKPPPQINGAAVIDQASATEA
jgi:hypothetical protein